MPLKNESLSPARNGRFRQARMVWGLLPTVTRLAKRDLKLSDGMRLVLIPTTPMTYTRDTEFGTWRIEEDSQRNWVVLKLKRGTDRWRVVNIFYTVAGAAAAVGCGETTDATWDHLPHHEPDFALENWQSHEPPSASQISAA